MKHLHHNSPESHDPNYVFSYQDLLKAYETRHRKRRRQLILVFILLLLCLITANTIFCTHLYTNSVKEQRIHTAEGVTQLAATFLDLDQIDQYLITGKDTPGYRKTEDILREIQKNSYGIEYLYVVKIEEDGCHFVFDTDMNPDDDVPTYQPGEVVDFEEAFLPYVSDLLAGKKINPIESNDVSGWVLTIYDPVYNDKGECICYVGTDVSLTDVRQVINRFLLWVGIESVIMLLVILILGGRLTLKYRKINEIEALTTQQEQSKQLIREIVKAFSKTVDMKDKYTNGHSVRVAEYTAMLTRELGYDEETVEKYYNIALMHDIGKIGIPAKVLNKPGKLTDEEFDQIKSHTVQGYHVLKDISIMPDLAEGARSHHERPDGKGYPNGLKGDEIPRVAQIIAVADTFDAMYSNRPYRKRMNFDKAVSIIKEVSGTQLTSDVVDAFLRLVEKGKFRAADDHGGGSTEDINNIRQSYQDASEKPAESSAQESTHPSSEKPASSSPDTQTAPPENQ